MNRDRDIKIILNVDENDIYLEKLRDRRYQYSQLHIRQGYIKYYTSGVALMNADMFRRGLTREDTNPMFETPYVVCLSINKGIEPNNKTIFRSGRRVYIPFGVNVQSIKLDGLVYKEFPPNVDFNMIKITECIVDFELKQIRINATVDSDFSVETNEYDKFRFFSEKIEPLYAHIQKVMIRTDISLYESDLIANEAFKMASTVLKNLDLLYSHDNNANRKVRERLVNALIGTDEPVISPDFSVMLKESDRKVKTNDFAAGLYEYKGAYFKDKFELDSQLKYMDMLGMTEEDIVREKKKDNRYEYLMVFLTSAQRLLEITDDEINDPIGVIFAMTEEETVEYERLRDKTDEKSKAARMEIARAAKLRWKEANNRL